VGNFGFWVDMATVTLDDNNISTIQAMPLGEYEHPVHGKIKFTPERIKTFADNVNNKVRGQDLDIDYDHKVQTMEAAGWVQAAEATPNGLALKVEWTKKAAEKIRNKEYRYFSPEFADEWQHPKTGKKFNDVLFGGALTNRPFLKDILPVNLSELFSDNQPSGGPMDPKELRKLLGLPETASDDEVRAKLEANQPPQPDPNNPPKDPEPTPTPPNPASGPTPPQPEPTPEPTPDDKELAKLAESSPAIKALMARLEETNKRLDESDKRARESELRLKLAELSDSKMALPPSVEDQLVAALADPNKVDVAKLFEAVGTLKKTGFVQLGERGRAGQQGAGNSDEYGRFEKAVKELMAKDDKLSYADAASQVALMDPDLYEAYRQNSYSFKEA
jgi:hypothetical protein